jgi:hypothetical protein
MNPRTPLFFIWLAALMFFALVILLAWGGCYVH